MYMLCTESGREAYGGRSGYAELGYFVYESDAQNMVRELTARIPGKSFYYVNKNTTIINPSLAQILDMFRDY